MGKVSMKRHVKNRQIDRKAAAVSASMTFTEATVKFFKTELDVDIVSEYKRLKSIGRLPSDQLMDRIALSREINASAENAKQANKIFLKAKAEREFFRIQFDRKMRDLNRRATEQVEVWKKRNKISKQTTQDMVKQELASDVELAKEYRTLIEKQEQLRAIKADCQLLAEEWAERKWTLRTQANLITAEREVKLPELDDFEGVKR